MAQCRDKCWERLESVIRWSGMTTNHFARHIGLMRAENLYQIKRGNNGISRKLAEMIVVAFPEIDLMWLLTGRGDMFCEEASDSSQIDYFEMDVESAIRQIDILEPHSKLMLTSGVDADIAMIYRGGAMGDQTPPNTVVMLKRIEPNVIIPGKEYLIQTKSIAALRVVRLHSFGEGEADRMYRLAAIRSDLFDDFFIEERQIERVYSVAAKLIINY